MKRILQLFILFSTLLILNGCIDVQTHINVNKDGSGTIRETMLLSRETVMMLQSFKSGISDSSKSNNDFDLFKEDELKKKAADYGPGVTYVSGQKISKDGQEGYTVLYKFKDINKLKLNENQVKKSPMEMGSKSKKDKSEYITFHLNRGSIPELVINMPEDKMKSSDETEVEKPDTAAADSGFAQMFYNMMKDFRIALVVHINGNIKSTNATYVNDSDITLLDVKFADLIKDKDKIALLSRSQNQSVDELKTLLKNIPGIKLELNRKIKVKFD